MARSAALLFIAALALGGSGCLRPRGTPEEPVVVEVGLEGVRSVSADALKERIATQASGRWAWDTPNRLDPDALSADRRRVEAFYRERGYYEAHASVAEKPAGNGRVTVIFRVEEGRPSRVEKLTVNGLDQAPEALAAASPLPLKVGDVFTESAYDAARAKIADALLRTGWAISGVTQKAEVDPERATVQVTYDVSAGRRWRFGQIAITAEPSLPRDKILGQAGAAIKPGAIWDESKLAVARERVFKLGAFGGVRVERAKPDEEAGTIAVVISVEPAPFRTVRVGPGFGLSPIEWDLHAVASWQHRNFFGDLRKFTLEGRGGYAWVPSPFRPIKRGPIGLLAVELAQPGALGRYLDLSTRVEVEKGIEQAYNFYAQRFRLSTPLRLAGRWTLVPSYSFELYELSAYGSVLTLQPGLTPTSGPLIQACKGSTCLLSYLEQVVAWDGRDNPLSAHRGLYVGISVQEGFHIGSYGYRYLRFLPEARLFHPLFGQTVLALRARIGALIPISETSAPPVVALFAAGGPSSMRGYYARRLAPMVLQSGQWVPVGANGLVDGTIELRFPVAGNIGAAVFLDAAAVSNDSAAPSEWQRALDPGALQFASGIGVRYLTPFGPLRVDLGIRLPDRLPLTSESFPAVPFTAWPNGALHREPIVAIQLSLGEAF